MDGDTIIIEEGQKVRYIGIDTPESVHSSKPIECFGKEASNKKKNWWKEKGQDLKQMFQIQTDTVVFFAMFGLVVPGFVKDEAFGRTQWTSKTLLPEPEGGILRSN